MPPGLSFVLALALALDAPRTATQLRQSAVEVEWGPALAAAKGRGVPILVEVWAPW